jgi:hypothetical protein
MKASFDAFKHELSELTIEHRADIADDIARVNDDACPNRLLSPAPRVE